MMKHSQSFWNCAHRGAAPGIAYDHICMVNPEGTRLYHMAMGDLVTAAERPARRKRLEWEAFDLDRGEMALQPVATCWAGPYLFGASRKRLGVLVIDLANGTLAHTCLRSTPARSCVCVWGVRVRVRWCVCVCVRAGSGKWQPITLVGQSTTIAREEATMCGSPSRLVVFGSATHISCPRFNADGVVARHLTRGPPQCSAFPP